jgi:hypothetical protein
MNYYYLIAGLPDISITDRQAALTPTQVIEELLAHVEGKDRDVLTLYLHKHDNANLLTLLSACEGDTTWDEAGLITRAELQAAVEAVRQQGDETETPLPDYMTEFLVGYLRPETLPDHDATPTEAARFALSRLSELYYRRATKSHNRMVAAWFAYERNLGNVLTACNCRRLGLDAAPYIIGDDAVASALRTSKAANWGLTEDECPDLEAVMQITAGTDAVDKERRLDDLRWQHLEEQIVLCHFGIERLLAFLIELDIIRRWQHLDAAMGEAKLRQMLEALKQGALQHPA